jgi:hypothetical protein
MPSLQHHHRVFRPAPNLCGTDRGFFNEQNVAASVKSGVGTVSIPQRGDKGPRNVRPTNDRPHSRTQAFSRWHRGAHLGVEARPRHEALPDTRR